MSRKRIIGFVGGTPIYEEPVKGPKETPKTSERIDQQELLNTYESKLNQFRLDLDKAASLDDLRTLAEKTEIVKSQVSAELKELEEKEEIGSGIFTLCLTGGLCVLGGFLGFRYLSDAGFIQNASEWIASNIGYIIEELDTMDVLGFGPETYHTIANYASKTLGIVGGILAGGGSGLLISEGVIHSTSPETVKSGPIYEKGCYIKQLDGLLQETRSLSE